MPIITFLSDFGDKDWFVSAVKAEILRINPWVKIIDITHNIKPFDVKQAAFVLKMVYKNFPEGTVHLAVVDPGVGGKRKPLIISSERYFFVGPDNGIFSYVIKDPVIYEIFQSAAVSATFHARDLFGPVSAKITLGVDLKLLGKRIRRCLKIPFPKIRKTGNKIYGEIIYLDHFGNCITNIPVKFAIKRIFFNDFQIAEVRGFYQRAKPAQAIAVKGSSGYYEIAVYKGQANKNLNLKVGDRIIAEI
ncbi:MAG: SAM hydrolase/SAM-dependent halogenase family protein [bacterium]